MQHRVIKQKLQRCSLSDYREPTSRSETDAFRGVWRSGFRAVSRPGEEVLKNPENATQDK